MKRRSSFLFEILSEKTVKPRCDKRHNSLLSIVKPLESVI